MIRRIVEKSSTMRIFMFLFNSTSKQSLTHSAPEYAVQSKTGAAHNGCTKTTTSLVNQQVGTLAQQALQEPG
jgi:hypothetical protein